MPAWLRRLSSHSALLVEHSDHQGIAAGAEASFQGRDIQQDAITNRRRSHEVGVHECEYLGFFIGVAPRHGELHGPLPLAAEAGNSAVSPNDHVPTLDP